MPQENHAESVIVVGGGLAGMVAAWGLARRGFRVSLFEGKQYLGGRMGSYSDETSQQRVDYCQHVGMQCCTSLIGWLDQIGAREDWSIQRQLHFYSSSGRHLPISAWPLPAPLHLTGLVLQWPDLTWRDRARVAWGLARLLHLSPRERSRPQRAVDWLKSHGQNQRCLDRFWSTILVSALGERIERVGLAATHKVLADGFAATRDAYHLWIPKYSLSDWINRRVEPALVRAGVTIHKEHWVRRLRWNSHRVTGIEVVNRSRHEGHAMPADHIVLAVPWYRVPDLLADGNDAAVQAARQLEGLESSPITGVHLWFDRPWLKTPHAILIDRFCQWVFPGPCLQQVAPNESYYQVVISGSRQLPRGNRDAVVTAVLDDLHPLFPESRQAALLRCRVVTDPNAVFSVTPEHEPSRLAVDHLADYGLWLCGDWTQTHWPATMESAVRSGNLVATRLEHF